MTAWAAFKPPKPKEAGVERGFVTWCAERGIDCPKMQDKKGWPDRFILLPDMRVLWIEFKRPGEKPTKLQDEIHAHLRRQGHVVEVCHSRVAAIAVVERWVGPARLPA